MGGESCKRGTGSTAERQRDDSNNVKPYYDEDGITIYNGDCRDVMEQVAPFVTLTLTDPPYNCGKLYGLHNDRMDPLDYSLWCKDWWTTVRALSKRIIVFPGHGNLPMWFNISKPSAVGCWYKPGNAGKGPLGFEEWEPFLYWIGDGGLLGGSSVIRCPIGKQRGLDAHPCPKPIDLFAKLLTKARADTVLDPFMGTGTTLVAAKRQGIRAVGIELEERYCEMAVDRLRQRVLGLTN